MNLYDPQGIAQGNTPVSSDKPTDKGDGSKCDKCKTAIQEGQVVVAQPGISWHDECFSQLGSLPLPSSSDKSLEELDLPTHLEQAIVKYKDAGGDDNFYVISQKEFDRMIVEYTTELVEMDKDLQLKFVQIINQ